MAEKGRQIMWTPSKIKSLRQGYKETQTDFALRLRVSKGCIANWEQGISTPLGPAEVLLDRLEEDLKEGKIRELQSA